VRREIKTSAAVFSTLIALLFPAVAHALRCPVPVSLASLGFPGALVGEGASPSCTPGTSGERSGVRATTDGRGSIVVAQTGVSATGLDLSNHFIRFRMRVRGEGRIGGMELRLGSSTSDYFSFALPVFVDPLFDPVQPGEWLTLSLSFSRARAVGEPDPHEIRQASWWVRDDASAPIEVEWMDLVAVPRPSEGVVSFTFDDGYTEHFEVAARSMQRYGFAGTAYVMPEQVDEPGYLAFEQLKALEALGWDVASHHAEPLTDWSDADLAFRLKGIRNWLAGRGFGRGAGHLAYPLGRHDPFRVLPAVRRVFETARVAGAGPETLPPADRYRLRAVNVLGGETTAEDLREVARSARAHGEWAILMFHHLVPGAARNALEYDQSEFERALRHIRESGVAVQTVSEVATRWNCPAGH